MIFTDTLQTIVLVIGAFVLMFISESFLSCLVIMLISESLSCSMLMLISECFRYDFQIPQFHQLSVFLWPMSPIDLMLISGCSFFCLPSIPSSSVAFVFPLLASVVFMFISESFP